VRVVPVAALKESWLPNWNREWRAGNSLATQITVTRNVKWWWRRRTRFRCDLDSAAQIDAFFVAAVAL
jgi:hypothetical protein